MSKVLDSATAPSGKDWQVGDRCKDRQEHTSTPEEWTIWEGKDGEMTNGGMVAKKVRAEEE